jgi:histidine ammonia-lyase
MDKIFYISNHFLSIDIVKSLLSNRYQIKLSEEAITQLNKARNFLDKKIKQDDATFYGINTGFGSLCNTQISFNELQKLQDNLLCSHACGTGETIPNEIVKLMLLLKAHALSYGNSGTTVKTVEQLLEMYNREMLPLVYEHGSLGASGDLAPLAHMSLPIIGEGKLNYDGEVFSCQELIQQGLWEASELESKEGLALINGTQFMSAFGVASYIKAQRLSDLADIIGALSLDAFYGRIDPFHPLVHEVRAHKGQIQTARRFLHLLKDSQINQSSPKEVQDPYSFRCIPQVHGATKDSLCFIKEVLETEINSVTDNPCVFPDEDLIISAGNFHGQPLALALDYLAIASAELGSISERRTYKLISGKRGLPPFLSKEAGLNSGFMIPQYTAASIVSRNKQLCTPASVDSIESSQGQEDHVSMGANAATKAWKVVNNLEQILAIELMNAAQAIEFRRPQKTSPFLEAFLNEYRQEVDFVEKDGVILSENIHKSIAFLQNTKIDFGAEE